ncbi:MAG: hypothetical protein H0T42_12510 [Deltaproteobacteria bacterium]|nr:hypothetical protein [Deltaproteobacteria bacterium]
MTSYLEVVRDSARKLSLLTPSGELKTLDSLSIIDLLDSLEAGSGLMIPLEQITTAAFADMQSVADLLARVASAKQG